VWQWGVSGGTPRPGPPRSIPPVTPGTVWRLMTKGTKKATRGPPCRRRPGICAAHSASAPERRTRGGNASCSPACAGPVPPSARPRRVSSPDCCPEASSVLESAAGPPHWSRPRPCCPPTSWSRSWPGPSAGRCSPAWCSAASPQLPVLPRRTPDRPHSRTRHRRRGAPRGRRGARRRRSTPSWSGRPALARPGWPSSWRSVTSPPVAAGLVLDPKGGTIRAILGAPPGRGHRADDPGRPDR